MDKGWVEEYETESTPGTGQLRAMGVAAQLDDTNGKPLVIAGYNLCNYVAAFVRKTQKLNLNLVESFDGAVPSFGITSQISREVDQKKGINPEIATLNNLNMN